MKRNIVMALFLVLLFWLFYSWRLTMLFNWDSDRVRDLYDVLIIIRGHPSLLGPPLTGGVFAGPYYYYFLVPVWILAGGNENWILVANAGLFAVSLGIVFLTLARRQRLYTALLATLSVGLLPVWVQAARHPGNAYSYLPLLLVLLLLATRKKQWKRWQLVAWGLIAGITINFHPAAVIVIIIALGIILNRLKRRGDILWLIMGLGVTFLPLIGFELRHDWVMTRAVTGGKFWRLVTDKPTEYVQKIGLFRYEPHYVLPLVLGGVWMGTMWLVNRRQKWLLIGVMGLWSILLWTSPPAADKMYTGKMYGWAVQKTIDSGWVDKDSQFNLVGISDEKKYVVAGNGYRYFYQKKGLSPLPLTDYNSAKVLVVFSEITLETGSLVSWETREFGLNYLDNSESIEMPGLIIYHFFKEKQKGNGEI